MVRGTHGAVQARCEQPGTSLTFLLPFLPKRLGLDPASSSAPFVATLVDVTGLAIYFQVAALIWRGDSALINDRLKPY